MGSLGRLAGDTRAVTIVEFAMVAPVLCLVLVGGFDIGHSLYMRATLQGVVQKAARDSSLEGGLNAQNLTAIDDRVREQVLALANTANVTFDRRYFSNYNQAERVHEAWTDSETPGDGICNHDEPYIDENGNGIWDADLGRSGQGAAKDAVMYRVTVRYPAMLPLWRFIGGSDEKVVQATTVLRNQPYGEQGLIQPEARNCAA